MKPLTEQDIAPLWDEVRRRDNPSNYVPLDSCTAGFRATVRSFAYAIRAKFGHCHASPGVSESEARERERAAFKAGFEIGAENCKKYYAAWIDEKYPSLTPQPPYIVGEVLLSDGSTHRLYRNGTWQGERPEPMIGGGQLCSFGPPQCVTAEDFEQCAKLLRESER